MEQITILCAEVAAEEIALALSPSLGNALARGVSSHVDGYLAPNSTTGRHTKPVCELEGQIVDLAAPYV